MAMVGKMVAEVRKMDFLVCREYEQWENGENEAYFK
jgi:hypothetical protein